MIHAQEKILRPWSPQDEPIKTDQGKKRPIQYQSQVTAPRATSTLHLSCLVTQDRMGGEPHRGRTRSPFEDGSLVRARCGPRRSCRMRYQRRRSCPLVRMMEVGLVKVVMARRGSHWKRRKCICRKAMSSSLCPRPGRASISVPEDI